MFENEQPRPQEFVALDVLVMVLIDIGLLALMFVSLGSQVGAAVWLGLAAVQFIAGLALISIGGARLRFGKALVYGIAIVSTPMLCLVGLGGLVFSVCSRR